MAKKLVIDHGIISVKDLKNAISKGKIKVNEKILLGLKYYGIVQGSIPRKETAQIEKYLTDIAHVIDPDLSLMICGSYRRGRITSGDIDVLLYHPKYKTENNKSKKQESYLEILVDELTEKGFLLDHMTDKTYDKKYMGFCKLNDYPVRRIDLRLIPYKSLPTAMLYFTGPYELNTNMRNAAKKRKMILNEYGLYKISDGEKIKIKINSEEDVFKALGMNYLEPSERETFNTGKIKLK